MFGQGKGAVDPVQPAPGRVQEDRVNRRLATAEGLLIAVITPPVGWLIDLFGSVDLVLVVAGLFIVLLLALSILVSGLIRSMHHHQAQVSWNTSGGLVGNSCWEGPGKAWLAS